MEMWASIADLLQSNTLRDLNAHRWFHSLVTRQALGNAFGRSSVLSVIDELRRFIGFCDNFEGVNIFGSPRIKIQEAVKVAKKISLVLMQLNVRNKSLVSDVMRERLFEKLHSFQREMTNLARFLQPGEMWMNCVEINHRREEDVRTVLLCREPEDVVLHCYIVTPAATMYDAPLACVGYENGRLQVHARV